MEDLVPALGSTPIPPCYKCGGTMRLFEQGLSLIGKCDDCGYSYATTNLSHPVFVNAPSYKPAKAPPTEYDPGLSANDIRAIKGALRFLPKVEGPILSMQMLPEGKILVRLGSISEPKDQSGLLVTMERTKYAWRAISTVLWSNRPRK